MNQPDSTTSLRRVVVNGATALLLGAVALTFLLVLLTQVTGTYRFVPVISGSMSPFVDAGDVAVLQPRHASDLIVGDVIAFEAPVDGSPLTLHRVIEIASPWPDLAIRTQGDANEAADPWIARLSDDELWRATSHVDNLGHPALFLNRAKTRFILMSIGVALFGWWGLVTIWRKPDQDDDDGDADDTGANAGDGDDSGANAGEDAPPAAEDAPSRGRMGALTLFAAAGVLLGVHGGAAASASFTGAVAGAQVISTAEASTPFTLDAQVLCSAGVPRAVELKWTAATNPVRQFDIYRGALTGGPYDTIVGSTDGDTFTFSDPLTGVVGAVPLYYIVRTSDPVHPEEQTNEAFALTLC